jgi:hypothetical protein
LIEHFRDHPDNYAVLLKHRQELEQSGNVDRETEFSETLDRLEAKRRRGEAARRQQTLQTGGIASDEDKASLRRIMEDKKPRQS